MGLKLKLTLIFFIVTAMTSLSYAQNDNSKKKTVFEKAHDRKVTTEEFVLTDNEVFKIKIYNIEKAEVNRTHHWFLKLADLDEQPLNFARVKLTGYLKSDPETKFNYMGMNRLCKEGKYLIGFVKVKQSGTWILEASVDNFGITDTFRYEIAIPDQRKES